jgi:hypothetical protein
MATEAEVESDVPAVNRELGRGDERDVDFALMEAASVLDRIVLLEHNKRQVGEEPIRLTRRVGDTRYC